MPNSAVKDSRLSLRARGLLLYCLSLPNDWKFSVAGLMKATGENQRGICQALNELEKFGYMKRTRTREGRRLNGINYVFFDQAQDVECEHVQSEHLHPVHVQNVNEQNEHVQSEHLQSEYVQNEAQLNKDITKYRFDKVKTEQSKERENGTPTPASDNVSDKQRAAFDKFWELYPRKQSKATARLAWMRLPYDTALYQRIYNAVESYKATRQWREVEYIPFPENFLADERWEDDIPEPRSEPTDIWDEVLAELEIDGSGNYDTT
ncbi:helix-turn-helix domain-containing protein [Phascolarctobacterium sp.]|uniref:helix-turn-helix domain-containing protein n=1 Tax=Phascolarctobacterium sp. TaxID=2049039 RepID=UPI003863A6C9